MSGIILRPGNVFQAFLELLLAISFEASTADLVFFTVPAVTEASNSRTGLSIFEEGLAFLETLRLAGRSYSVQTGEVPASLVANVFAKEGVGG
ncbi:hypothetical protein [Rhizobium rhizoryzae]|uniref:hypothetical protein n=1 Tax=Rhizobium rhizoryzae TaxID=451876 RepID=UPI0028ABA55E|nr:hypothetical protein [Rhizobium rhizoryzae]